MRFSRIELLNSEMKKFDLFKMNMSQIMSFLNYVMFESNHLKSILCRYLPDINPYKCTTIVLKSAQLSILHVYNRLTHQVDVDTNY